MKIEIKRKPKTKAQMGDFFIDDKLICQTLEPLDCIPTGKYNLVINRSNRFKKLMPLLYNTPDDEVEGNGRIWNGIRIHAGNTIKDTQGCILVGFNDLDSLTDSKFCFDGIMDRLIEYYREPNDILKIVIV